MQKWLIIVGILCIAAGLLWPIVGKIPLGRLPGDIVINRPHLKVFFPITTMVLVSLLISIVLWLLKK
jgi:hypothetical protein